MDPTEHEDIEENLLVDVAAQASSCEAGGAASEGHVGESFKTWSGSGFDQGHNSRRTGLDLPNSGKLLWRLSVQEIVSPSVG